MVESESEPAIAEAVAVTVAATVALAKWKDCQIVDQPRKDTEKPVEGKMANGGWKRRMKITTLSITIMLTYHA